MFMAIAEHMMNILHDNHWIMLLIFDDATIFKHK